MQDTLHAENAPFRIGIYRGSASLLSTIAYYTNLYISYPQTVSHCSLSEECPVSNSSPVSGKIVPLTIIKGAGHEHIPIPEGENAIVADFHSIQTETTASKCHFTTGFYRVVPGPTRYGSYDYEETKYVLRGQIDVTVSKPWTRS